MRMIPLTEAKAKLNELVDDAVTMHEQFTITRRGRAAAMLVSVDEWESLQDSLFWQSVPGTRDDLTEARSELAEGEGYAEGQVRSALGLPPRS